MTMLNTQVRIQNKTGGVTSTVSLDTFWTSGTADVGNVNWADLPGFGVNDLWIAITNNMFTVAADTFSGA
jgi:hypothetical protein